MSKITMLKGAKIGPEAVLGRALEDVKNGDCEEAVVILQNSDGTDVRWSNMSVAALVYAHRVMGVEIDRLIAGERALCEH